MSGNAQRHGGRVLAEALAAHGVPRVFSVPGESYLAVLDGLFDVDIPNIVCRHEGGAAMMAEATGKLTGRPGVAFVTRGPGATNASAGVHVARQDSTPMILFVGQIARGDRDREVFQEVDYRAMFGPLAKWVAEIDDTDRIPEYVNRAFRVAMSGRPGPVVLALPEDMLAAPCSARPRKPAPLAETDLSTGDVAQLTDFLTGGERPLIVLGGSQWNQKSATQLQVWAEAHDLPVAVSFRRQDYIDNRSPSYVGDLAVGGNAKLFARLAAADRLLLLGCRFTDIATAGYTALDPAGDVPPICHVHPDPDLPGTVWPTELAITARAPDMVAALCESTFASNAGWRDWTAAMRADYEGFQKPVETPGTVKLEQVIRWLSDSLPDNAVLTNGAGNYAAFLHRYYRFRQHGTQVAPTSGSMGYGFPASIAASLHAPGRVVVCLAGDGCFQMTLNEMSTAIQHGATPIVVVANNGRYGTIRMHQEKHYPGRVSGTDLANPDFAALARAYGGHGETVTAQDQFAEAFNRARDSGKPAVIEVVLDPDMLTTAQGLSDMRNANRD